MQYNFSYDNKDNKHSKLYFLATYYATDIYSFNRQLTTCLLRRGLDNTVISRASETYTKQTQINLRINTF